MKVSNIKLVHICSHIHELEEELSDEEKIQLEQIALPAAVSFCKGHTGLDEKGLDKHEDITIAVLAIIADMWDNRSFTITNNKINPTVDAILSMHSDNLLPNAEV